MTVEIERNPTFLREPELVQEPKLVQEYVQSAGESLRVDAARGVLRGVKLLGLHSRNGRRYEEQALRKSIGLYEGSKVNVNHPTRDPLAPRDYRDRLGVVRNVRLEAGRGLFGDLHYNPSHALAEQLAWDAANAPENVGLSHNVLAKTRVEKGEVVVESITRVQSVDLVADPATTAGLFEAAVEGPLEADARLEEGTLREQSEGLAARLHEAEAALALEKRRCLLERTFRERGVTGASLEVVLAEAEFQALIEASETDLPELIGRQIQRLSLLREERRPKCREQVAVGSGGVCGSAAEFVAAVTRRR
jgi:hypothetical protein